MNPDKLEDLKQIIAKNGQGSEALLAILLDIQHKYQYLPEEMLVAICELTDITPAAIQAVSTFYPRFRLKPAGKHIIRVCIGTACHVKGGQQVFESFRQDLNIPEGEDTDHNKLFTVEKVACLGCCMLAVAVQIDDTIYGWVKPGKTQGIMDDFLKYHADNESIRQEKQWQSAIAEVRICLCSSCNASGADKVYAEIKRCAAKYQLPVRALDVGCTGMSFHSPLLQIVDAKNQSFNYAGVTVDAVSTILLHHFKPHSSVRFFDHLITADADPLSRYRIPSPIEKKQSWMTLQTRITTEHCGQISPLDLEGYQKVQGFKGFKKALSLSSEQIIKQIMDSGLRGRGGAGFPTGTKWQQARQAQAPKKYVICNADEGDPGAFMDRLLLESFPFRVIEGMLIAAKAIGAKEGLIYVRDEYPLAVLRLRKAIQACQSVGLLGNHIMESDFSFEIKVFKGGGAFVCGEETAMIASMESRRGIPHLRPPYPSERGYHDAPTLINNVETLATIPWIFIHGSNSFRTFGTKNSPGTKTFALAGKINRGGLVEIPLGMSIRCIIDEIGGGVPHQRRLKAVQIGGPSGGCIPESLFDLPVDYESLSSAGSMMGSGGLIVLDETDCMVDIARYFLAFTVAESCGKCTFCRVGLQRMLEILNDLCEGRAKPRDLQRLKKLATEIKQGSLCGLGQTAPNPILSTLQHFPQEYTAHLQGRCPAGKCKELFAFQMNDKCTGCMICSRNCPVSAIPFIPWEHAKIDQVKCVRCGVCRTHCPEKAIEVAS